MASIPILESERLLLRPFSLEDAIAIYEILNDKEIATNTHNFPYPYQPEMAKRWIIGHGSLYEQGIALTLAITLKNSHTVIGAIALDFDKENDKAELGYWLGRKYWGQGYATEAANCLLDYGFTELKLNRIHSCHLSHNTASGRVLQKAGMSHEGHLHKHYKKWGHYEDVELYGILLSDFKARKNSSFK